MDNLELTAKDGTAFHIDMPPKGRGRPIFVLSAAKCGSTLMFKMLMEYFKAAGVPFSNPTGRLFELGLNAAQMTGDFYAAIDERPSVYMGFRTLYNLDRCATWRHADKLVLVRDPRDALVSHYFSVRHSHALPERGRVRENLLRARDRAAGTDINEYILRVKGGAFIPDTLRVYSKLHPRKTTFYRYEDVIFAKSRWLDHMLRRMHIADIDQGLVASIAEGNDIRPANEDAAEHVRQVTPGNYRKHLTSRTVAWIERQYTDVFLRFGYDLTQMTAPDDRRERNPPLDLELTNA